jgi:hypothetical protein
LIKSDPTAARIHSLIKGTGDTFEKDEMKRILTERRPDVKLHSRQDVRNLIDPKPNQKTIAFSDESDDEMTIDFKAFKARNKNNSVEKAISIKREKNIVFEPTDPNRPFNKKQKISQDEVEKLKQEAENAKLKPVFRSTLDDIGKKPTTRTGSHSIAEKFGIDLTSEEYKNQLYAKSEFAEDAAKAETKKVVSYLKLEEFKENLAAKRDSVTEVKVSAYYCKEV